MTSQEEHDKKYPEHVKLRAVKDDSQKIGAFLDWLLNERHLVLCDSDGNELHPTDMRIEALLGLYFEVDLEKLEEEKLAMIDEMRKINSADGSGPDAEGPKPDTEDA
jgi:hypothetical protein